MNNQNYAKEATIAQIEKQKQFFEIPPYQRLYEWGKDEIETLLDDMKKAYDENKEQYFIGNITTSKKSENEREKFVLIDGQQRLTTLWFIGFYLASKGCDNWKEFILQNDNLRITMPIRENEEKALKDLASNIAGKENLAQFLLGKDIYQNIFNAFERIESWFASGNGKDIDLAKFAKYIYESVCFVFVELAQTDLNRFFVRMNNRGKQLEKHEILKARILDKIKDDKDWQKYAKIWDLCSDMNKYIFQSASDRNILNSENEGGEKWGIDKIIGEFDDKSAKSTQNDDTPDKVESIIDFPTFLLHCLKLYAHNNSKNDISISKDKLLDIFDLDSVEKWDSKSCKCFITDMLYYRVLFDYFVIKNNAEQGNGFRIRRLYSYTKNKTTYYRLPEDSKSVADSPLHNLAMIQNYLRVARQGDRQNYHHWLTPFLIYLDSEKICKRIWKDCICEDNFGEIVELFKTDTAESFDKTKMITFLENLDTNLAIAQLSDNELLNEANKAIKEVQNYQLTETPANIDLDSFLDSLLNNGTGTPHYWFYRLEYYLWKWGKYKPEKLGSFCKKLDDYNFDLKAKNCVLNSNYFHFRMLGSIEHFSAIQRERKQEKWGNLDKLDIFGNLALISQNFNSSLSNQLEQFKKDEVIKQLKRGRLESLKYFIMCANLNGDEWTENDAQAHQKQMIGILIKSLKSSQEK